MRVIANTSPLHYLILIEHIAILPVLFGHVLIPTVVADDREAREEATRQALETIGTLRTLEMAAERGMLDLPAAITKLLATSFYAPASILRDMLARDVARKGQR
jgi:predicted nucleic acid-binding protein